MRFETIFVMATIFSSRWKHSKPPRYIAPTRTTKITTIQCLLVDGKTLCPRSRSLATDVVPLPVYTAFTWQGFCMSLYGKYTSHCDETHGDTNELKPSIKHCTVLKLRYVCVVRVENRNHVIILPAAHTSRGDDV
jgi:hypothetical protein